MKRGLSIFWYVVTLQCEEAERIRCCSEHGATTRWERLGEWLHRFACRSCRRARRELHALDTAVRHLVHAEHHGAEPQAGEAHLSDEARERIAAALRQARPNPGE